MTKTGRSVGIIAGMILCASLMGCSSNAERLRAFLQEPRRPVSASEYRVLPPDIITVTSLHVPEINNATQQVRPDGKVNIPLLGEVYVADHTPQEIEEIIKKASREFYEQVDATVRVTDYRSQKIYVFGQVSRPGPIPWTGNDSLVDILATAQPTQLAWPEKIRVVRGRPPLRGGYMPPDKKHDKDKEAAEKDDDACDEDIPPEEGGGKAEWDAEAKAAVMVVNMMHMIKKGDMSRNVFLKPDDVIYVPPNPLAAIGLAIQQLLLPIQPAAQTISAPASAASIVTGLP